MSVSSVITLGYKVGVNFLPTLGYTPGSAPVVNTDTHDGVPKRKIMLPIYERKKIAALETATEELVKEITEAVEAIPLPVAALEWDNTAIEAYARQTAQSIEKIQAQIDKMLDDEEDDFLEFAASILIH